MAETPNQEQPPATKKRFPKTLGIVLGVAIGEALVFGLIFKFAGGGGPAAAYGEGTHAVEAPTSRPVGLAEVLVLKSFRAPNDKTGRLYIYDLDVTVVVAEDQKERASALVQQHAAEIGDRVARIVRSASDRVLREDDLRALRQQILDALREITRDETLIQRVLIPRFVPMRTD